MRIVCFGQTNWDWCWTGKQHLLTELAKRGHEVLYVDPHWSYPEEEPPNARTGLRKERARLHVYTYRYRPALRWRLNRLVHRRRLQQAVRRLEMERPACLVLHPEAAPLLQLLKPSVLVYYAIDEMTAYGGTTEQEASKLRRLEEELARKSDAVAAISPRLLRRMQKLNEQAFLLPSGANVEHFAQVGLSTLEANRALPAGREPVIGFIGQLDERLDQELAAELARMRPLYRFVFIGRQKRGVSFRALEDMPNVYLLGYQPYEALPGLLQGLDACLVPYVSDELTQSCSPLKVYEYLAAGRPVITRRLEGLEECRGVVRTAETAEEFARQIDAALNEDEAAAASRRAFAHQHSWKQRCDVLEEKLRKAAAERRGIYRRADSGSEARYTFSTKPPSRKMLLFAGVVGALGNLLLLVRRARSLFKGGRRAGGLRILVARRCRLGDAVCLLPLLNALRRKLPEAEIIVGLSPDTPKVVRELLDHVPAVDDVRVLDQLGGRSRLSNIAGAARLLTHGYDAVLLGSSYFLTYEGLVCGAPLRVSTDDGHPLHALASRRIALDSEQHEVDNNLALLQALGLEVEESDRRLVLELDEERAMSAAEKILQQAGVGSRQKLIGLHLGAAKASRQWPPAYFAALCTRLLERDQDLAIVLTGTAGEAYLGDELRARLGAAGSERIYPLFGRTTLESLAGLMKRAECFVCNDTGVMHFARARGARLVCLLGPENNARWGPYEHADGPVLVLRRAVPCLPCVLEECEQQYCMRVLKPEFVAERLLTFLADDTSSTAGESGRCSWEDLQELGFSLPTVAVVPLGVPGCDKPRVEQQLALESYPAARVLFPPAGQGSFSDELREILDQSEAEFYSFRACPWSVIPGELDAHVATLVRNKAAAGAGQQRLHAGLALSASELSGLTVRREWLSQELQSGTGRTTPAHVVDSREVLVA